MKKYMLLICALLLVSIITIPNTVLANTRYSFSDDVTYDEAIIAAQYYIEKFGSTILPEWEAAKHGDVVCYYSVGKTKIAYEFTIIDGDKEAGFLIIAAQRQMMPALEWGTGRAPSSYLPNISQLAINEGYVNYQGLEQSDLTILYWGALSYSVQIGEKMVSEGISYHLPSGIISRVPQEQPTLKMDQATAYAAWAAIENEIIGNKILRADTNEINGVPAWYQSINPHPSCDEGNAQTWYPLCVGENDDFWNHWDGCAPISGAMVLGYWNDNGYGGLPDNDETLIDRCHGEMGTSVTGNTTVSNIDDGIEYVSQNMVMSLMPQHCRVVGLT